MVSPRLWLRAQTAAQPTQWSPHQGRERLRIRLMVTMPSGESCTRAGETLVLLVWLRPDYTAQNVLRRVSEIVEASFSDRAFFMSLRVAFVPVKILIVDDHDVVREGVRAILQKRADWEICGEASNGKEAVDKTIKLHPDVIILDVTMPSMNGLDAAREVLLKEPGTRVVMFTMHDAKTVESAAIKTGAKGLVLKSRASRDLIPALDTVIEGGTFFPSSLAAAGTPQQKPDPK